MKIIVTGGLGFIGKHFIASCSDHDVINIDAMTYAADMDAIGDAMFIPSNICDLTKLPTHDILINFAAESHVDRSINDCTPFVRSNVVGVQNLLQLHPKRFIQISTDEVYGEINGDSVDETAPLYPCNPYAATKAAADHLILAHDRAHDINFNIIRPANNYGHRQYPEKLIPRSLRLIHEGLPAEIHGDGSYTRMWLNVKDTVNAIWRVIRYGENKAIYNIGGEEKSVLDIVKIISLKTGGDYVFIKNRSAQDYRYAINDTKIRALGWNPQPFDITEIIENYRNENSLLPG